MVVVVGPSVTVTDVLWLNGRLSRRRSAIVPSDSALATSYRLSLVTICSGLDAIFNKKFQATSGRISETVRDRAKVTINH